MTDSKPKASKAILTKKSTILGGILITMLTILLAFYIPSLMSDGTERLSGDQKKIAELQLKEAPRLLDATDRFAKMILKYRVESIYETPKDQLAFWCGSNIDKSKTYYSVVIGEYSLFGAKIGEFTRHDSCAFITE